VVSFSNGERRRYDIQRVLCHEAFFPLRNPAFFKNLSIEPGGCALSWNSELDISEYELWRHGERIV
jgi:hypothetical protein